MHRLQFADAEYLPRTAPKLGVALPIVEATTAEDLGWSQGVAKP